MQHSIALQILETTESSARDIGALHNQLADQGQSPPGELLTTDRAQLLAVWVLALVPTVRH